MIILTWKVKARVTQLYMLLLSANKNSYDMGSPNVSL